MKTLHFDGFEGSAEIDTDRQVCRGKLLFIADLVTYEAESPRDLQAAFEEAVADYVATCRELGREAQKPFRGGFQVRVNPELHRAAAVRAARDDVSLNDVMVRALDCYIHGSGEVHNVTIRVESLTSTASEASPVWTNLSTSSSTHVRH